MNSTISFITEESTTFFTLTKIDLDNPYRRPSWNSWTTIILFSINILLVSLNLGGNILTILALNLSNKLSTLLSNQFILNLALSDILVGVSILYHNLFYVGPQYEKIKYLCILKFVFIFFACSSSIYNLLGIAADRYLAVVYPLHYARYMTKKVAMLINCFGWMISFSLALILVWWNRYSDDTDVCVLVKIVPEEYVVFITIPMFTMVWIAMFVLYAKIWKEAKVHTKRMKNFLGCHDAVPDDSKSIQLICFILGCFSVCWLPYFTYIILVKLQGTTYINYTYEIAFTMAMTNSCMNPIIYAWKNRNFRTAFWCLLRCKSPNSTNKKTFITNHVPSKNRLSNCNVICKINENSLERKGSDANFSVQTTNSTVHL